jgi:preprotein translocase subunit SecD
MRLLYFVLALAVSFCAGCANVESGNPGEKEIPLAQVPNRAIQAAQNAVDGIALTEAEVEIEDGQTIYVLEGMAKGTEYEIEVTSAGKVLEVEQEADDDEDDDADEDDDDEDDDDDDDDDDEDDDDDDDEDDDDDDDEDDDD